LLRLGYPQVSLYLFNFSPVAVKLLPLFYTSATIQQLLRYRSQHISLVCDILDSTKEINIFEASSLNHQFKTHIADIYHLSVSTNLNFTGTSIRGNANNAAQSVEDIPINKDEVIQRGYRSTRNLLTAIKLKPYFMAWLIAVLFSNTTTDAHTRIFIQLCQCKL
jgi:hypothetical protein